MPRLTYSPKITINAVEITIACHPPPKTPSKRIGKVSFTMTLDSNNVTKTQCLPLSNSSDTFLAFSLSEGDPDSIKTWRFVWSRPINPIVRPIMYSSDRGESMHFTCWTIYQRILRPKELEMWCWLAFPKTQAIHRWQEDRHWVQLLKILKDDPRYFLIKQTMKMQIFFLAYNCKRFLSFFFLVYEKERKRERRKMERGIHR